MMKQIKFVRDCTVEAQGQIVQTFKAGEVHELSASSARRWLRRNMATEVQGSAKPEATKSAAKPAVKKSTVKKRKTPITAGEGGDKPAPATSTETASE